MSGPEAVPSYDVHRMNADHVTQQIALERKRKELRLPCIEDIDTRRLPDPAVVEKLGKALHTRVDEALDSVARGDLGPVQYEQWLQLIALLRDVLFAYRNHRGEHSAPSNECYVYDHLRLDRRMHESEGFEPRLKWPLE